MLRKLTNSFRSSAREPVERKTAVLQKRLQDMVVFELREDGGQEYHVVTLRSLYDYVLKCITNQSYYSSSYSSIQKNEGERHSAERGPPFKPTRARKPTMTITRDSDQSHTEREESFLSLGKQTLNSSKVDEHDTSSNHELRCVTGAEWRSETSNITEMKIPTDPIPPITLTGERLGGYLHPRDVRRLASPFSSSNAPELMIRRHVMLINFDPLRAILLRDRLLVIVPDGADSILMELQRKMDERSNHEMNMHDPLSYNPKSADLNDEHLDDEWNLIQRNQFIHIAFELQAVDAVLGTVCTLINNDASFLKEQIHSVIEEFRRGSAPGDHAQDGFRKLKDSMKQLEGRVLGIIRALNQTLDNDTDLALMNLSRLITHPQRFIQPVSRTILSEESEDPGLILETYLQQILSEFNTLGLLRGNLSHAEDQVLLKLDAIRNRILYINNVVTVLGLCFTFAACVASFYGMNLQNKLEEKPHAFGITVAITTVASTAILSYFIRMMRRSGKISGKDKRKAFQTFQKFKRK